MQELIDLILFLIYVISVVITILFSDEIAEFFNKEKLNLLQLYVVSASIGFISILILALFIAKTNVDMATNLIASHFAENIKEEVFITIISPLLKLIR